MAVVKANCYGHDIEICVPELLAEGVDLFGVASVEEGHRLRALGVEARIAVLSYPLPAQYAEFAELDLEPLVSTRQTVDDLAAIAAAAGRVLRIHLFVDTGMGRNGAPPEQALDILHAIAAHPSLRIQGFASHFATSDEIDGAFVGRQLAIFDGALRCALDAGFTFPEIHIANSGGSLNFPQSHYTLVRPGLALYGYHPTAELQHGSGLEPVMTLRTVIGGLKRMPGGVPISYGRRYHTRSETTIATIPIGYGDGLPRALTNRLDVLVGGRRHPVVGTICMDEVMVDLGDTPGVAGGDEVIVIGRSGQTAIDAWELAANASTIPYEICAQITARVPRVADEPAPAS
jgi:alanine racemase